MDEVNISAITERATVSFAQYPHARLPRQLQTIESLIILRDVAILNRRTFREILLKK